MLGLGNILTKGGAVLGFPNKYSFNFDGSNDYLEIDAKLPALTTKSISCWVYFDTFAITGAYPNTVWSFTDSSGGNEGHLRIQTDGKLGLYVAATRYVNANTACSLNTWHHVLITQESTGSVYSKIYLDGTDVTDGTNTFNFTSTSTGIFTLGQEYDGTTPSDFLDGLIDEFAIWDTALSADDVAKIASKPVDFSKASTYATDRTSNLKLWLRAGDKAEPESTTAIARQDFYTDFDGTDDYINAGSDSSIDDIWAGGGTLTAWIYPRSGGENDLGMIYAKRGGGSVGSIFHLQDISGGVCNLRFYQYRATTVGNWKTTLREITLNEWNHIALSFDSDDTSNNPSIYVNGTIVALTQTGSQSGAINSDASVDLYIGSDGGDYSFDGVISNFSLHQTILDAQTISQMAKSRFTPMRDNRFSVVDFDGSNDYIATNADSTLADATYTFWANSTETGNNRGVFGHGGDDKGAFHFNYSSSRPLLYMGSNRYRYWNDNSAQDDGQWHHWAVIVDADDITGCKLYIDGVEQTASTTKNTGDYNAYTTGLDIGRSDTANEWIGSMAQFAVYSDLKDDEFIYAQWSKGITADYSNDTNLTGYWRMGDGAGDNFRVIRDQSSNSNDGTMNNMQLDDIVQQMVAGYDLGAYDNSSEIYSDELVADSELNQELDFNEDNDYWILDTDIKMTGGQIVGLDGGNANLDPRDGLGNTIGLNAGTLYKITIDVAEGTFVYRLGTGNNASNTGFHDYSTQNTKYFLPTTDGDFQGLVLGSSSTAYKLNSFSIKEVLQSEVSDTYPAIIDVNEPVLGEELVTNGTFDSNIDDWSPYNSARGTISWSNGRLRVDNTTGTGNYYLVQTQDFYAGKVYKISIDVFGIQGTETALKFFFSNTEPHTLNTSEYKSGDTYTVYLIPTADVTYFMIGGSGLPAIYELDNITIKEIQGNVGTMTNQDSADLVYSSVLPDQSFLTGVNSAYNFLDFDGVDAYVDIGSSINDALAGSSTISFWTKVDLGTGSQQVFLGAYNSSVTHLFLFNKLTDGEIEIIYEANNQRGTADTDNAIFVSGQNDWKHIVGVIDDTSNQINIYVNGDLQTLDSTNDGDISNVTNSDFDLDINLIIGARNQFGTPARFFNGSINQFAIWNKALSSSEVSAIYKAGRHTNLLDSYSDNLKGYYAFGALDAITGLPDTDSTIYDRSGNSNHGTTSGTATGDLKSPPNAEPNGYAKGDTNRSTTTP